MSEPVRIFLAAHSPGTRESGRSHPAIASATFEAVYSSDEGDPKTTHHEPRLGHAVREPLRSVLAAIARAHAGGTVLAVAEASVAQTLVAVLLDAPTDGGNVWFASSGLALLEGGPDGRGVLRSLNAHRAPPPRRAGPTRVALVRHGHAMNPDAGVFSHNPIPLSAVGRTEAERVAAALAPLGIDALYSSDIVRARETADICARRLGIDVNVDEGLRELTIGDFEGTTLERVRTGHPAFLPWLEVTFRARFPTDDFHHPADLRFPNGQSVLDNHQTSLAAFRRILAAESDRTIAIVSHGWVLQPLLCHIARVDPRNYFRFTLPTATIAVADVDTDSRGIVRTFNGGIDIGDLPKMLGAAI